MKYQDQVDIITNIENNFPVNNLVYKNIRIWPIIRLAIWQSIFDGPSEPKQSTPKKSISKRLIRFLSKVFFLKNNIYRKTETVFLIAPSERKVLVEDKYYSPFSNSLNDILKEARIPSSVLDLGKRRLPVYGDTYFIDQETIDHPVLSKIFKHLKKYFIATKNNISEWDKLTSYMETHHPKHTPNKTAIIKYCENVIRYENIFTRILKKIEPKVAFLVCYYHPAAMGYIKACYKLGIKSVDIQHGDHYGMYRNWTKLPKEGYQLLPSSWWCWGKGSADEINNWSIPAHPNHKAFVGGNPWISRFINNSVKNTETNKSKINVLVALTNVAYPVENIVLAIKNSPNNINWILRPHPAMPNEIDKFKQVAERFTMDKSTLVFESFRNVDFIITPCSTVAYEALLFKVHPTITHADGKEKFHNYIDKGLFSYAETDDKILEVLQKNKSNFNFKEDVPYMETNMAKIKENLLNLIRS